MRATFRMTAATVVTVVLMMMAMMSLADNANAQVRVPDAGMAAVGGDVGFYLPGDDFNPAPTIAGSYEYYFTPRVSLRTSLGWTNPHFDFNDNDSLRQTRLTFAVLYNWERGKWHPFVGGGLGAYFLQYKSNGNSSGDGDRKLGVNAGGGIEYFTSRTVSLKGEAQAHFIGDDTDLPWSPSGIALLFGVKKYF